MRQTPLLCTRRHDVQERKGIRMAKKEPVTSPQAHDNAAHVRDYGRFTQLFKWGAIVCFLIAMLVLLIIS